MVSHSWANGSLCLMINEASSAIVVMLRYNFTLLTLNLVTFWKGVPLIVGRCGCVVGQRIQLVLPIRQYIW